MIFKIIAKIDDARFIKIIKFLKPDIEWHLLEAEGKLLCLKDYIEVLKAEIEGRKTALRGGPKKNGKMDITVYGEEDGESVVKLVIVCAEENGKKKFKVFRNGRVIAKEEWE